MTRFVKVVSPCSRLAWKTLRDRYGAVGAWFIACSNFGGPDWWWSVMSNACYARIGLARVVAVSRHVSDELW